MGCDINLHIETEKDGKWYHYGNPFVYRDYALFTMIAGERLGRRPSNMEPTIGLATHCEIPDNASFVTKYSYELDKNDHHVTCTCVLSADNIPELQHQYEKYCGKRPGSLDTDLEHTIFQTYVNHDALCCHEGWDDLRIICWFD